MLEYQNVFLSWIRLHCTEQWHFQVSLLLNHPPLSRTIKSYGKRAVLPLWVWHLWWLWKCAVDNNCVITGYSICPVLVGTPSANIWEYSCKALLLWGVVNTATAKGKTLHSCFGKLDGYNDFPISHRMENYFVEEIVY